MNRRIFCAMVSAMAVGCSGEAGPKTTKVSGDVNFDGKPLDEGTIEFSAADGSHAAQGSIKAGKYEIPAEAGPIVGKQYKVSVVSLKKSGKARKSLMPGSLGNDEEESVNIIPAQYHGSATTLTASVSEDETKNKFDFSLDKGPATKK
ncbi:MAG: hypothetical protein ACKO0V_22270 [bacterium]